jgi:hypothetical protein
MEPASQDSANTVLERAIPDTRPAGIPCVVIELAQKRGDIKEVKGATREPRRKDFQELVPLVREHANGEGAGVELAAQAAAEVGIKRQEFVLTEADRDQGVNRIAQDGKKASGTRGDRAFKVGKYVSIQAVIHMHTVWWGKARPVRGEHTGVEGVSISRSEGQSFSGSWSDGMENGRKIWGCLRNH